MRKIYSKMRKIYSKMRKIYAKTRKLNMFIYMKMGKSKYQV